MFIWSTFFLITFFTLSQKPCCGKLFYFITLPLLSWQTLLSPLIPPKLLSFPKLLCTQCVFHMCPVEHSYEEVHPDGLPTLCSGPPKAPVVEWFLTTWEFHLVSSFCRSVAPVTEAARLSPCVVVVPSSHASSLVPAAARAPGALLWWWKNPTYITCCTTWCLFLLRQYLFYVFEKKQVWEVCFAWMICTAVHSSCTEWVLRQRGWVCHSRGARRSLVAAKVGITRLLAGNHFCTALFFCFPGPADLLTSPSSVFFSLPVFSKGICHFPNTFFRPFKYQ